MHRYPFKEIYLKLQKNLKGPI